MKIGLFYGSSTCYTEMAAEKIRDILGEELVDLHNIKDVDPQRMEDYSTLILGIPTWDFGEIQEDWENIWGQLAALNLKGKVVALYGMGDQLGYSEWFPWMRWACCMTNCCRWVSHLLGTGRQKAMISSVQNRWLLTANTLSGWRWTK
ncbi:Flavodoxin 2 [Pectobacterium sp. F1-1]|nr:Flavodoxin 2 [Pectobacterium sp. F1-1]